MSKQDPSEVELDEILAMFEDGVLSGKAGYRDNQLTRTEAKQRLLQWRDEAIRRYSLEQAGFIVHERENCWCGGLQP